MINLRTIWRVVTQAPFTVALALAVLFMLAAQPAANAKISNFQVHEPDSLVTSFGARAEHHTSHAGDHLEDAAAQHDRSLAHHFEDGQTMAEQCCDLQCSPAAWIPPAQDDLTDCRARGFEPAAMVDMHSGAYEADIRPPRL